MATSSPTRLDVEVEGMTCAACAARVQRSLNELDGVTATVNLATERATVQFAPGAATVEAIAGQIERAGYHARLPQRGRDEGHQHPADSDRLQLRLAVAVVLSIPVVALAMVPALRFSGWEWVAAALTTPVVVWAAWPIHHATIRGLRRGAANMDTLISVGTLSAYGWSLYAAAASQPVYFEAAAATTALILTGRVLESRARREAGAALRGLLDRGAKEVTVLASGTPSRIAIDELQVGDLFVAAPGEAIATDGVVMEGSSAVDRSLISGEPVPVEVGPGDPVTGATINAGGRLVVRATAVGADTAVARIGRMVEDAQTGKSSAQRLADRVSAVFVPAVIGIAALTLVGWLAAGNAAGVSVEAAVAVLIVACPCALGLAIPTAILVGSGRGAELGIVIRRPEALERAGRVTTIVLDKTGTVTDGRAEVNDLRMAAGAERLPTLRLAGAVAAANDHPVSRAVAAFAARESGDLPPVSSLQAVPGRGATATVEGHRVELGRNDRTSGTEVRIDGTPAAWFTVGDDAKPTSREAVAMLRRLGLTPVLLSGDTAEAAQRVAQKVGIDRVVADVLPEQKVAEVERLRGSGEVVAMAGDGTNDAPALAAADLGIAMGGGTDVAIEAGDLTLVSGDLRSVADAVSLARATRRTMVENLGWAFAYNAVLIPLAIAGLLEPMAAAAAMACSSLAVVGNSLRLRRFAGFRKEQA